MTDINSINQNSLLNNVGKGTTAATDKGSLAQKDFLKLLVAQLANQDPMSPQDPGAFLGQMAQFGTVDGVGELNNTMSTLLNGLNSNKALQASSLVGRNVQVPSNVSILNSEEGMNGSVKLDHSATDLTVTIKASNGQVVRKIPMGMHGAGYTDFHWDGKMENGELAEPGKYHISAEATLGRNSVAYPTYALANVDSVTLENNNRDVILNVNGLGAVSLDRVEKIA